MACKPDASLFYLLVGDPIVLREVTCPLLMEPIAVVVMRGRMMMHWQYTNAKTTQRHCGSIDP